MVWQIFTAAKDSITNPQTQTKIVNPQIDSGKILLKETVLVTSVQSTVTDALLL